MLDAWCYNAANEYGIRSGFSWGSATENVKNEWIKKSCNKNEKIESGACLEGKLIICLVDRF